MCVSHYCKGIQLVVKVHPSLPPHSCKKPRDTAPLSGGVAALAADLSVDQKQSRADDKYSSENIAQSRIGF